ncbi:uncharacterized protein LOC144108768 [Amblyomma americanum]
MATWRSTILAAAALVLLAGIQSVACDRQCNVTKATTCYWSQAYVYGVEVLKPTKSVDFLQNVCASEQELPKYSVCSEYYNDCTEEEKESFTDQEKGYKEIQEKVTDPLLCKGVKNLTVCINADKLFDCQVNFADHYSPENAQKNLKAANHLRKCLDEALEPCTPKWSKPLDQFLKDIANGVVDIYSYKAPVTTPAPTEQTTTEAQTTTIAPPTSTSEQTTTQEPTSQQTTTQEPTSEQTTTHESSTQAPTTPAPPSGAPSVHAVGVFGFVAIALLARGA